MSLLTNKNVLLGITGGIAAYKSAEFVRLLIKQGANVKVVMTKAAQAFITPLTLQTLSSSKVYTDFLSQNTDDPMAHISLARWADVVFIAPASANIIARLARGLADDLLSTLCLATTAPIILAPAMNQQMWKKATVQSNIQALKNQSIKILATDFGDQACGEFGLGRMLEPESLVQALTELFQPGILNGVSVLITAGPTYESLDPVRYLTNRSSGKMGYAIAQAANDAGAKVRLISGPTTLPLPQVSSVTFVETAEEMSQAVMSMVDQSAVFISVAAVSDYRVARLLSHKMKKNNKRMTLDLIPNPDILATVAALPKPPLTVGFAAETQNVIDYARGKLIDKNLDIIVANQVNKNTGFGDVSTAVTIIPQQGKTVSLNKVAKHQVARKLIKCIAQQLAFKAKYREVTKN